MFYFKKQQSRLKDKSGKLLWHPVIVASRQVVDTRKIARELAARSGATEGDVIGILHDLGLVMREHLAEGNRVVLDGIGSFKISAQAKGNGVEQEAEVSAKQFNHVKVLFTPETRSNRTLRIKEISLISPDLKFALTPDQVEPSTKPKDGTPPSSTDGEDDVAGI